MVDQISVGEGVLDGDVLYRKRTRCDEFLATLNAIVPRAALREEIQL